MKSRERFYTTPWERATYGGLADATEDLILFDDDTKITTGVEDVVEEAEAVTAETPTDVYTISGMIVRSQVPYAEALRDLPRGIYTDKPTAIRMTRDDPQPSGWKI